MTPDEGKVHRYGLRFLEDVWRYYVARVISARQAILLAHVDHFVNPLDFSPVVEKQWGLEEETVDPGPDPVESKLFRTSTLQTILQCSRWTVRSTILDLRRLRKVFKARKVAKDLWELKTRPRDAKQGFYVYPIVRKTFEHGLLSPVEMLVLADIASFTLKDQFYWKSNQQLGKRLGLRIEGVRYHLQKLRRKGLLEQEEMTHDEAREALRRLDYEKPFKRRGCRITRLLFPVHGEFWSAGRRRDLVP
jgi:DNA-binding CsgD family transcriptional regulator